jgi:hypothetical protein
MDGSLLRRLRAIFVPRFTRHAAALAEALGAGGALVLAASPDGAVRGASAAVVGTVLVVEGGNARLFGWSAIAFSFAWPLASVVPTLSGPAGATAVSLLTLTWIVAMGVPAAIASDRSLRRLSPSVQRFRNVPYLGAIFGGYLALAGSLGTLWFTTTSPDPLRASIQLAFLTAGGIAAAAAVREDRRRTKRLRAGALRRD